MDRTVKRQAGTATFETAKVRDERARDGGQRRQGKVWGNLIWLVLVAGMALVFGGRVLNRFLPGLFQ